MKHAANRSQATVKPKAKSLTRANAVKKIKPAAKQSAGKINIKSAQKTLVQKTKSAVKNSPKSSPRAINPTTKQTTPKLSAKTLIALKTLSVRKNESAVKQTAKPKAKKNALQTPAKTIKTSAQKTKPISSVKKISETVKSAKKAATAQKTKPAVKSAKPKVFARPIAKISVEKVKSQSPEIVAPVVKSRRAIKNLAPTVKVKTVRKTAKSVAVSVKNSKNIKPTNLSAAAKSLKHMEKAQPTAKPVQQKKTTPAAAATTRKVDGKSKKVKPLVTAKEIVKKTEKAKPIVAAKKAVVKTSIAKTSIAKPIVAAVPTNGKIRRLKPFASITAIKKPTSKIEKVSSGRKVEVIEKIIETPPITPKPKNKKVKPIGSAVFRGKKERYDFKVFALNEKFEPIPAVYIISKRKTDRNKKGHHALICIGETASIADELKRHRKGKCVKKHEANVVSILPEADEKMRLKIEMDLKAAHTIVCQLD